MINEFKKCDKPDCLRLVRQGTNYCCFPCGLAAEGGYEIHEDGPLGHTEGCDQRHAERSQQGDEIMQFTVAPGVGAALANRNDRRAYYLFDGDLNQMGLIYEALLRAGFPVVKNDVFPGFTRDAEEEYKRALAFLYRNRIEGWWSQRRKLIEYGICTEKEYLSALGVE